MRKRLIQAVKSANEGRPLNKVFLSDVMTAIEKYDKLNSHKPSEWYKPSSLNCLRQMYFMRTKTEPDETVTEYNSIGMADTGSRRHVAIQTVLENMEKMGYDWKYVDVEDYINMKKKQGKCLFLDVVGKHGAETKLFDSSMKLMFLCDGIIQKISTGEYYLFEFKNQISFKANGKEYVDKEHYNQVSAYCAELDLSKAFVLYENRDNCNLECPELFEVTQDMKDKFFDRLLDCEGYVERLIVPPKCDNTKTCRWCKYKTACRKV